LALSVYYELNTMLNRPFAVRRLPSAILFILLAGCQHSAPDGQLFTRLSKSDTGIDFRNLVTEKETFNIFKYQYFYNGGGVAIGDFNNDGLQDVFFTGNMVKNRLYLNKGKLAFEDITKQSHVADLEGWCTGATPVDINNDGWLDLYICRAGYPFDNLRYNLLYINNGDAGKNGGVPTFTEKSAEYGLNDLAYATQAVFFDYDKDGDLDVFLLNHSTVEYSRGSLEVIPLRQKQNPAFTNKLLRNDGGKFTDVTRDAGIYSNVLTFSLGIAVSDINNDGWPDIFISNDFNEPDYILINNGPGAGGTVTFTDRSRTYLDHTSLFSMGVDFADINNDGLPDFATLDMLPESNHLQKMHAGVDNFDKVSMLTNAGLLRQYSRNMLQRNNGDGTFSEIAQMAGVSNTDWSWSPLLFDFDNDGWKDLFISNGYLRDHTDMDFLKFTADEVQRIQRGEKNIGFDDYIKKMPPIGQPNYFFRNDGDGFHFTNQTADWGDPVASVSQGAAYADLDNDGDLDLVVNNSNEYAFVYRNNASELFHNHYLKLKFKGNTGNGAGVGTKVYAWTPKGLIYQEQSPVRGFQSAMDPVMNLGLGQTGQIDSLVIIWPTNEKQVLTQVKADQLLEVKQSEAMGRYTYPKPGIKRLLSEVPGLIPFKHQENNYNDFKTQLLLPWYYSRPGPALATGDVTGDGLDDVFCGGAAGQASQVYLQNAAGDFHAASQPAFEADAGLEAAAAVFFDADGDGDPDLYVVSGGYESASPDRLYFNENGRWVRHSMDNPKRDGGGSCVAAADIDGDGDVDLFVGSSVRSGRFPERSGADLVLINDGKGNFKPIEIPTLGITTGAVWANVCGDDRPDLIVSAEWAPVQIFENRNGSFVPRPDLLPAEAVSGLWQCIIAADVDGDGKIDLIAGNLGTNSQLSAKPDQPLELYAGDFDGNGSIDPLMFYYVQGKSWPFPAMEDMITQIPPFKKKFIYFKDYADAGLHDILNDQMLKTAMHLKAVTLHSTVFRNEGNKFTATPLPDAAQVAPIRALAWTDLNGDGHPDLLTAGNMSMVKVKLGSMDGNHGLVLAGDGKGHFEPVAYGRSGMNLRGDARGLGVIKRGGRKCVLAGVNNVGVMGYESEK
jgi:hypothetical protein